MRNADFRLPVVIALAVGLGATFGLGQDSEKPAAEAKEEPKAAARKQLYTGKVVLLEEALERRGVKAYEENKGQVVLETFDGRMFPVVADWRGRAFYQDERLRDRKVELICNERPGVPYLQVLAVFTFDETGSRRFTDYWCDICAIPMYEIKPCDCCQGDSRLRFRKQDLPDYLEGPARIPVGRRTATGEPSSEDAP